jgi:hypothetical protein
VTIPVNELINNIQIAAHNKATNIHTFGHWLINIIDQWNEDPEQHYLKLFLKFVTGNRHLNFGHFPEIFIEVTNASTDSLPTASTCFKTLKSPKYESQAKMKEKFEKAFEMCDTFEIR